MMGQAFPHTISRPAAVVAPGPHGAGRDPVHGQGVRCPPQPGRVRRVLRCAGTSPRAGSPATSSPSWAGACLAAWFLQATIHVSSSFGSNYPATGFSAFNAFVMETVLTFGLVSVILGTASGAQNLGVIGALGVGAYIALAGLWASPISGASMNPARTFGPDAISANFGSYWVYVAGPLAGRCRRRGHRLRAPRPGRRGGRVGRRAGRPVHRGGPAREGLTATGAPAGARHESSGHHVDPWRSRSSHCATTTQRPRRAR